MHRYRKRPKIPPLFVPLQDYNYTELGRHLFLAQLNLADLYLTKDERSLSILTNLFEWTQFKLSKKPENEENSSNSNKKKRKNKKQSSNETNQNSNENSHLNFSLYTYEPPILTTEESHIDQSERQMKLYQWTIQCLLNSIHHQNQKINCPIDYSNILPEFANVNSLYMYAQMPTDDLISIYRAYPYDFFNVCSQMTPQFANDFIIACLFNEKIPIHLGSRLISFFPLTKIQIDYTVVYERRCHTFNNMCALFEGLLCNCNNQLKAAEILAGGYEDSALNDDCLVLINSSIRSFSYFVDKDLKKTIELFQSASTIQFLIQTATMSLLELRQLLKTAKPTEYVTRLRNQISLLEFLKIGDDWKKLEKWSIPILLAAAYKRSRISSEILFEIPRDSIFFIYPTRNWEIDFDFIQSFIAVQSIILDYQPNPYPDYLNYDIFSLLFLPKKRRIIPKRTKKPNIENMKRSEMKPNIHIKQHQPIKRVTKQNPDSQMNSNNQVTLSRINHSNAITKDRRNTIPNNRTNQISPTVQNNQVSLKQRKQTIQSKHTNGQINRNIQTAQTQSKQTTQNNCTTSNQLVNQNKQTAQFPQNISNQNKQDKQVNSNIANKNDFFFDVETALRIVNFIQKNGKPPQDLLPYLNSAEKKLKSCLLLFESPTLNHSLLTTNDYFMKSLNSIETITKMIEIYGTAPLYVQSKLFSLKIVKTIGLKPTQSIKSIPLKGRLHPNHKISEKTENSIQSILSEFPNPIQGQILLDLASSERKLSVLVTLIKNSVLTPILRKFYQKLSQPIKRYPINLNFNKARSISDYNKLLTGILSFHLFNTHLDQFCRLLYNLTTIKSQSFYKFQHVRTQIQLHVLINSLDWSTLKQKMRGTGIDPLEFLIHRNRPDLCTLNFFEKAISEEPLIFIPFARNKNISDNKLASFITKPNFHRVKKYLSFPKSNSGEDLSLIIDKINHIEDQNKQMFLLDDLIYQHENISNYFHDILKIIKDFPVDWCVTFIETFISLLDANNPAVIPLTKRLNDIKPLSNDLSENEIERVQGRWDTLIKLASDNEDVINHPQRYHRLCAFHLQSHLIGSDIITIIKYFCFILVAVKNFKLAENVHQFSKKYLKESVTSMKFEDIANMIIDIGLNYSFECGAIIAKHCQEIDLSNNIINNISKSIYLVSYVKDPISLLTTVLQKQKVNSVSSETFLLKFLSKIHNMASEIPLFIILNEFVHIGVYYRYKIAYDGQSLQKLYDIALAIGCMKLIDYFKSIQINLSNSVQNKFERNLSLFGLISDIDKKTEKKLIFVSPKVNYSYDDAFSNKKDELNSPTLFSIEFHDCSICVYRLSIPKRDIKVFYRPDFSFFEIQKKSKELRINDNFPQVFLNNLKEYRNIETSENQQESIKFINLQNMKTMVSKYLGAVRIFDLFESISSSNLHTLLKFANVKGLIYLIYQITKFCENHSELNKIFIFPKSSLKEYPESEKQQKLQEFIDALQCVLIKSFEFTSYVDSLDLLPSNVIISGNVNQLKDINTLLDYQSEIGIEHNLFILNPNDKVNLIARLFYDMEFERGLNLTSILKLDLNSVLAKTVKIVRDENDITKLGKFLFNIVPRLDMDTANELIKTISTNLAKNDANKPILNLLVSGIDDSRNVYQMLLNFGFNETAAYVAIQEGLSDEIENSNAEAKSKGNDHLVRSCNRWINQNNVKKDVNIQIDSIDDK